MPLSHADMTSFLDLHTFCKASFGIDILNVVDGDADLVAFTAAVEGCKGQAFSVGQVGDV